MSKIIERIRQFAESQYDSMREFERDAGVTQGVFSKSFKNSTEIRTDSVESFAESFPQVSAEWLLRGVGEMLTQSEDSVMKNPTLDFVIRHLASENEKLQAKIDDLNAECKELRNERDDLIERNHELEKILARKGEIVSIAVGSSDASAV